MGDTTSITETFGAALENLNEVSAEPKSGEHLHLRWGEELVADKGYHSNAIVSDFDALNVRTYISHPDRGRRNWHDKADAREAVYANRRRIKAHAESG